MADSIIPFNNSSSEMYPLAYVTSAVMGYSGGDYVASCDMSIRESVPALTAFTYVGVRYEYPAAVIVRPGDTAHINIDGTDISCTVNLSMTGNMHIEASSETTSGTIIIMVIATPNSI